MFNHPPNFSLFFQSLEQLGLNLSHAVDVVGVGGVQPLHASEMDLVQHASPQRIQEFTLGRNVAKQAVTQYIHGTSNHHVSDIAILKTTQGLPIWPEGIVGSISHTHNLAVAVCADQKKVKALGVDVEKMRAVNTKLKNKLLTEHECLQSWGGEHHQALVTLFSVKESIYKTACAIAEQPISLKPFSVTHIKNNQFICDVSDMVGGSNVMVKGRYAHVDTAVISLAYCVE